MTRLLPRRDAGHDALERRTLTSLAWSPPARMISLAGVHAGAGTSTLCLLLAHAIAMLGDGPALAVDLAGRSRGGLAVLAGAAGQTTAEATCALAAIHGGRLEDLFGVSEHGVRIIGTHPDGVEKLDRSHETLAARLVEAVDSGADDARLAALARLAVRDDRSWQALRWDNDEAADAVARVLEQVAPQHALVTVDLGMLDDSQLGASVGERSDLHVWVVPASRASLEIAERRLPLVPLEPAGREAIAVWQADGTSPSAKRLSALGDLRGCPVVRVAHHGALGDELSSRTQCCLSGISELCELAH